MKLKYLITMGMLLSASVQASDNEYDQTYLKYGIGIFRTSDFGVGRTKTGAIGYKDSLYGPIIEQKEVGFWSDTSSNGRRSSAYGGYSVGLEVHPSFFVVSSTWGATLITSPDSALGGPFQFKQDLFLGVRDSTGASMGLDYEHISSAGLEMPNLGKDFMTVRIGLPF